MQLFGTWISRTPAKKKPKNPQGSEGNLAAYNFGSEETRNKGSQHPGSLRNLHWQQYDFSS